MPELEAVKVFVCQDCGFSANKDDVSDRSPVYECSNCGEVYTKDDTDAGDHKCPSCSRFGGKVGEVSCPDCNTGIMEEQLGDMKATLDEAWDKFHLLFTIDFKDKKRVKNRWK